MGTDMFVTMTRVQVHEHDPTSLYTTLDHQGACTATDDECITFKLSSKMQDSLSERITSWSSLCQCAIIQSQIQVYGHMY